jgi:hypothetical protein
MPGEAGSTGMRQRAKDCDCQTAKADEKGCRMLWFVNLVGYYALRILIGTAAFPDNETARDYRLATGALIIGWLIGCVRYWKWKRSSNYDPLQQREARTRKRVVSFFIIPIAMILFTFLLENLRKTLG